MRARFSFDPALASFLGRGLRGGAFEYDCARAATLKNAIEALGVPHTEVGRLTVNGVPATIQRIVREGDEVNVHGWKSGPDPDLRFIADAHLGALARFLRMLGFDTLHRNGFADEEIRLLAQEEKRIVLTRDRELLKCSDIARWRRSRGPFPCVFAAICRSRRWSGRKSRIFCRPRCTSNMSASYAAPAASGCSGRARTTSACASRFVTLCFYRDRRRHSGPPANS